MISLKDKVHNLPKRPGVYLFKNNRGEVIYVGKAKDLCKRVASYFHRNNHDQKTQIMIPQIADLEYTIVSSETESLILENDLIKQYRPRFNIRLRDDKNYQFIKIDYSFEIPQIFTVRKLERIRNGRARFFGPYTSGLSVRRTMELIDRAFHLCRNKKIGPKPCFSYHLNRCPGVCIGKVPLSEYRKTFEQIEQFLRHRQPKIIAELKREMAVAAAEKRFEKAAVARNRISALQSIWEKQKIVSTAGENIDYVGIYRAAKVAIIYLLLVRHGRMVHREQFELEHEGASEEEILEKFLLHYYADASDPGKLIALPLELKLAPVLQEALKKQARNRNIKIFAPIKGKKRNLVGLASENAKVTYENSIASFEKHRREVRALEEIKNLLHLKAPPNRIEGFDISNIQGTNPVGSMVVFLNGQPAKNQYRKFKINRQTTPDDFAMMREMLERRFERSGQEAESWPLPDLIIIDGGKGQLNVLTAVLSEKKFPIPSLGLAKRLEEIFLPGNKSSIRLPDDSPILMLFERIRDEAHRFALGYHILRRSKEQLRSRLDEIQGIGPKTKKILLSKFGSVGAIQNASLEALSEAVGLDKAKKIKTNL